MPSIASLKIIMMTAGVLTFLSLPAAAQTKTIRIAADPWCPYNCGPDDQDRGLLVDLATEALKISGYTVDYQIMNWARAKQQVKTGALDGIVGMSRTAASESLYQFSDQPLGLSQVCFFRRASSNWTYTSADSLTGKRMGWINGFGFANEPGIEKWIEAHKHGDQLITLSGNNLHSRLFILLEKGRIDTFAEDRAVIAYALNKEQLTDKISVAGCTAAQDEVHVAFSLKAKDSIKWARSLESGVKLMKENGTLTSILSKYGLDEQSWLP